ncbi:MAG TPA: endopeptidase La [Candidatus Dormibacteraeota bacterium]
MSEIPVAPNLEGAVPTHLPVLPLKSTVVFPRIFIPLSVGRRRSLELLDDLPGAERHIAVATQLDEALEEVGFKDVHHVGAMVRVQHMLKLPDGTVQLAVLGLRRIKLTGVIAEEPYLTCRVEMLPESHESIPAIEREALLRRAVSSFQQLVTLAPHLPAELASAAGAIDEPLHLAYYIANHIRLTTEQRQEILEMDSAKEKLERLLGFMSHELEVLELGRKIQSQAEEQMGKAQREYFLREQVKAIQRELGELDSEHAGEIGEMRERIEKAGLPPEAQREADRELARLERIPSASPESSVIRTYLELIVSLPWNTSTGGEVDVANARKILDDDHYDLDKVKQRIVEHLAVRRLKQVRGSTERGREPILCFVGPPGVGKTSLGHSIARAMGRKFARASLGGIHDEAEIRGHRRTYIGAMPGRILQAIRRAESNDPVFMLDEVDKIGADWRGDPSSALLEVLDPEQNKDFRDNYLDVPFDLSKVMFITTANALDTIPPALRDRMEVLALSGYTEEEKVQIAEKFLVPKQLLAHGLRPGEVTMSEDAVRLIVRQYTREAGVRNLEREIASVMRRAVADMAVGKRPRRTVDVKRVRAALGKRRFHDEAAERIDRPGVATGLVWTPTGGEIVFVEAALTPGKGELRLTGQLGEVMKESASAALSYLKEHAAALGIENSVFEKNDIHVHIPAGAQPKEGPSAGVSVLTAMASILTGRPARDDIAMTGEITLRGRVLPIGGVKEKVLGAHRAGIRRVLLPSRNEADLDDIPSDLRKEMQLVLVDSIDQVLREALTKVRVMAGSGANGSARASSSARATVSARAPGSARAQRARPSRRAVRARRRPVA